MARKKYAVEIAATAERDVLEIHDWIARDKPSAATRWVKEVKRQINALEKMPSRHEVIPEANDLGVDYRHIVFGNYRTIYRVAGERVIILRVIHASRLLDTRLLTENNPAS